MKVSVIIPCFNGRQYLEECLRSVRRLSESIDEVLVVDDGSTENIRELVERFAPMVRYVWQPNAGLAAARNTGIRETSGRYIRLLDADDYLLPTGAACEQVQLLDTHPEIGLVYAQAVRVDELGQPFGLKTPPFARSSYVRSGDLELADLIVRNHILPSTSIIRRSVLDRVGGFRAGMRRTEDWDLWLRIAQISSVAYVAEPVVAYRIRGESLTASNEPAAALETHITILERLYADPVIAQRYAALERVARADLYARMVRQATGAGQRRLALRYFLKMLAYGVGHRQWRNIVWCLWLVVRSGIPTALYRRGQLLKRRRQVAIMSAQYRRWMNL